MATIKLHILNAGNDLAGYELLTQEAFDVSLPRICALLPLEGLDVVVQAGQQVIPETGMAGYCPAAHLVYISLDSANENLKKGFEKNFCATLAHEMHHALRWRGPGYGATLGEVLVSEGLACHFETEVCNGAVPFYARALTSDTQLRLWDQAHSSLHKEKYDHGAWFFGCEDMNIPRHAGYSLGFALVDGYIRRTGKKASSLAHIPAREFYKGNGHE